MKNRRSTNDAQQGNTLPIPDIDIIDLENDGMAEAAAEPTPSGTHSMHAIAPRKEKKKNGSSRINVHIILLIVFLLFIAGIIYKIMNYGVHVNLDEIFKDGPGTYEDNLDTILPLFDAEGTPVYKHYGEGSTIVLFGNAPFADDRDSEDNLANMIQQMTGATVYNCSVSGSYLAAGDRELDAEAHPVDIFNFYWLCSLATGYHETTDAQFHRGMEILGDSAPSEAWDVYNTLTSIDLSTVDVVAVMYDGSDYLAGHAMFNPEDATDITTFTGATEAVIEYMQFYYSNVRIIIMSPTYAFALEENGDYISSDMKRYGGQDVLSTYAILQYASCVSRSVTFIDNIYNTINEDNAEKYLSDHIHLNPKGRQKVAERFAYALSYYNGQFGQTAAPQQN